MKKNEKRKREKNYLQEKRENKGKKKERNLEICDYKRVVILQMFIKMNKFKVEL